MPAIGPFAQQGLRTYPLLLRDVVLVRGGQQSTPFMQTLAATIASAGRRLTCQVAHASGRWHYNGRIVAEPARRPDSRPDLFRGS